jgi:hypothetical protein
LHWIAGVKNVRKEKAMAHKKKHTGRVPPGNRPAGAPGTPVPDHETAQADTASGAPFNDQDPKRRLGNYSGAGEHPYQQPGGLNDANR